MNVYALHLRLRAGILETGQVIPERVSIAVKPAPMNKCRLELMLLVFERDGDNCSPLAGICSQLGGMR